MDWNFTEILKVFNHRDKSKLLLDGTWGLERETQRITSTGDIALTDHPIVLGNKLENSDITTDFAESQLELITEPCKTVEQTYITLKDLHMKVEKALENEFLWPMSMPPRLPDEKNIPIAKFDSSKKGREREIYRKGLALRYGKKMQMICGLHYNFSFGSLILEELFLQFGKNQTKDNFTNKIYFSVARNFLKYRWLLIYLFGASPSFDPSYNSRIDLDIEDAISLRVSPFGYCNTFQKKYSVTYNDLEKHIEDVRKLLTTKSNDFVELGTYKGDQQVQLNDNILQEEGELYSFIRFKQTLQKEETQLEALEKRGVKYIEVRILDINPFVKEGISIEQLYFMQVFMLYCLFENSAFVTNETLEKADKNHDRVALYGRRKDLILEQYNDMKITLKDWSQEIFEKLKIIAVYMDQGNNHKKYEEVVNQEYEKIINASKLLSSKISDEMKQYHMSHLQFGIKRAILNSKIQ